MEHVLRTRLVSILILVVVSGSGFLLGLAAEDNLGANPPPEEVVEINGEEERPRRAIIYEQVDPTPAQLVLIDSIIQVHRDRRKALDDEYYARFRVILDGTREGIMAAFTAAQAAEYQRLLEEHDARRAAERERTDRRD